MTHVRYLQNIKFFNGLSDIRKGEVVRVTRHIGKNAAWVVRDNGDTWAEMRIDGVQAEYITAGPSISNGFTPRMDRTGTREA